MPNSSELRMSIMRLARRIKHERGGGDLADAQRSALFFLYDEGAQSLGSLSEYDKVTPPSMNRTVGQLVALGFVTRETSATDGRKVSIEITDEGRAIVDDTRRRRNAWFESRLATLSAHDRAILDAAGPVLYKLSAS